MPLNIDITIGMRISFFTYPLSPSLKVFGVDVDSSWISLYENLYELSFDLIMEENHCQIYIMLYEAISSNFSCMLRYVMMELLKYKFYFKIILQFFFDIIWRYITSVIVYVHRVKMPSCGVLINFIYNCIGRFDMFCNTKLNLSILSFFIMIFLSI